MHLFALSALALLTLILLWLLRWRDYRLPVRALKAEPDVPAAALPTTEGPQVSVVIPTHNEEEALADTLRALLTQQGVRFEIIVVDIASSDNTDSLLEAFTTAHPALIRQTHVPASARALNRRQLALTLGIRAAYAPYVVLTRPGCIPFTDDWLLTMLRHFGEGVDVVAAYTSFAYEDEAHYRTATWSRVRSFLRQLRVHRRGYLAADDTNLALRREAFFRCEGFTPVRRAPFGEGQLLSHLLTRQGQAVIAMGENAQVQQPLPPAYALRSRHAESYETLRHLPHVWRRLRWRNGLATCCAAFFALTVCLQTTILSTSLFCLLSAQTPAGLIPLPPMMAQWLSAVTPPELIGASVLTLLLLLIALIVPIRLANRAADALSEPRPNLRLWTYALTQPWRNLRARLSQLRHRKEYHIPIVPPTD